MGRILKQRRLWLIALLCSLLACIATAAVILIGAPGDTSNPAVTFVSEQTTVALPAAGRRRSAARNWPTLGLSGQRGARLELSRPLKPPFIERWRLTGSVLLEFSPSLCRGRLFLLKNNGALYALQAGSGRVLWKRKLGYLAASSPTCTKGSVYAVLLQRGKAIRAGRVVALSTRDGHTRWSRRLPSRAESSPLLIGGRIFFGSENGTVYALHRANGKISWTHRAAGAVKGALATDSGRIFFGDYRGNVTALRRTDGRRLWRVTTHGRRFGLGRGTFYSTPAIAFGRLYIGNTDGYVYSFGLSDGALAWRRRTGGYVYSSPGISGAQGGTVFVGSYDRHIYALNARTGTVRWRRRTGGRIVGGPVVIGNLVFYSNLGTKSTAALTVNTGRLVWSLGRGAFNPVISDGRRLFINGYSTIYMFSQRGRRSR